MTVSSGGVPGFKLYHCPATRSARAKWALHETLGDDFEVQLVNLYAGDQYRREFVAMNPAHNVPVLEVRFENGENFHLRESAAIVSWLADAFPDKRLAPPSGQSKASADYFQMLHFGASPMDMMLWQIRIHESLFGPNARDEKTSARYRAKFMDEVEPLLAARLEKAEHICGDDFTAADIVIGHNVGWARAYGLCTDHIFARYQKSLTKRPAFLAAFADARSFPIEPPAPLRDDSPFNG